MLGRDVVLEKISANSGGHVVAVGYLEDDSADKGYIVKVDTNTGEVLWDRTLERNISGFGLGNPSTGSTDGITPAHVKCTACYIDSQDQIYVVGTIDGNSPNDNGVGEFLIKYTAEGNMVWQRERDTRDYVNTDGAPNMVPFDVKSDGETEQTVVLSVEDGGAFALNNSDIFISKYSKNGDLVFRRRISKGGDNLGAACLDADPSFYYIMFRDQQIDGLAGEPDRYTFGKVSTSGNGFGNFQYDDGEDIIDYTIVSNAENKIGRLSDGSVRNDTSDLMTYPFTANKLVFDDLATQVSNKKRQMDSADSFEYSGSPAIRPADFQELNLLGDVYSGSGDWLDQSGKGNDGVVNGATYNTAGYFDFDGVNDEIDFGNQASIITSGSFTVEAWAWRDTITAENGLFDIEDSNQGVILLSAGNNGGNDYRFLVRKGSYGAGPVQANVEAAITGHGLNEWHHYLGTYDDDTGTIIMYVDGVQVATDTNASIIGVNFSGTLDSGIHIGPSAGRGRWHDGRVGEVRVYPKTLTAAQVFQNYNATKSKFINEAPDTAPKIGPGIVYGSDLLLNYDFGNRATYDRAENLYTYSNNFDKDGAAENFWSGAGGANNRQYMGKIGPNGEDVWQFDLIQRSGASEGEASFQQRILPAYPVGTVTSQRWLMRSAPGYGTQTVYHKHGRNAVYGDNQANVEFDITEEWSEITTTESVYTGNTKEFFGIGTVNAGVVVQIASAQLWIGSENARYVDTYGVRLTAPTTVKNLSGSSYPGTITDATFNSAGYFEFDGDGTTTLDSIDIPEWTNKEVKTVEIWFNNANAVPNDDTPIGGPTTYQQLVNWGESPAGITLGSWTSAATNESISVWSYNNSNGRLTYLDVAVATGIHHLVVTWNTTNNHYYIYLDNVRQTEIAGSGGHAELRSYTDAMTIGANIGNGFGTRYHFNGNVHEYRVYDRELTSAEVSQNFNATRGKYGV